MQPSLAVANPEAAMAATGAVISSLATAHLVDTERSVHEARTAEWQIAQKNGLDRIWDCGTMKFELNII